MANKVLRKLGMGMSVMMMASQLNGMSVLAAPEENLGDAQEESFETEQEDIETDGTDICVEEDIERLEGTAEEVIPPTDIKWERPGILAVKPASSEDIIYGATIIKDGKYVGDEGLGYILRGLDDDGYFRYNISALFNGSGTYQAKVNVSKNWNSNVVYSTEKPEIEWIEPETRVETPSNLRWKKRDDEQFAVAVCDPVDNAYMYYFALYEDNQQKALYGVWSNSCDFSDDIGDINEHNYCFCVDKVVSNDLTQYANYIAPQNAEKSPIYDPNKLDEPITEGVVIDANNFPDEIFRNYVSENFDTVKDGVLTNDEIDNAKSIDIHNNFELTSIKGIELFPEITSITISFTDLRSLDVSHNTKLDYLGCNDNNISELNVSNNSGLSAINCTRNNLTNLDISNCSGLKQLWCDDNLLASLDVSHNTALIELMCHLNNITTLDVSNNDKLQVLCCYGCNINTLDITNNPLIQKTYENGEISNHNVSFSDNKHFNGSYSLVSYEYSNYETYEFCKLLVDSPEIITYNRGGNPVNPTDPAKSTAFVDRIYTVWLERTPDSDGAEAWTKRLENRFWSGAQVAEFFVFSKESMDKNRSNEDFIDALYKLLMNRDPAEDPSGYTYWKGQMQNGMSKYQLVASFIASPEYTQICTDYGIERGSVDMDTVNQVQGFVGRFYTLAMERDADQAGVDYWTAGLRRGDFNGASIAANFFFSKEMTDKHISDEKYIELLYQVMMGRPSDDGGKSYWLGNMEDGMTNEQVLNGFITSLEFTGICADYGIERGNL